jgi:prevent-host-death family protein
MLEVGAFEAKNTLGSLLDRVEQGEEVAITRHGKRVARLVADTGRIDQEAARAALARMDARRSQSGMKIFDWETLKADRDEGRP